MNQQLTPILDAFGDITGLGIVTKSITSDTLPTELDGYLTIGFVQGELTVPFVFYKELRSTQVEKISQLHDHVGPIVILSTYMTPKVKELLRKKDIGYIDSAGNTSLQTDDHFILIEGQSYPKRESKYADRAFTKTGLQLLFYFLHDNELINATYRDIRSKVDVSLDTINKTLNSLKKQKYILTVNKSERTLTNKKDLLDRWITGYDNKLKTDLLVGRFSFVGQDYRKNWKQIPINTPQTVWSGQPAAELLTNNVIPDTYLLYSTEDRTDLIKNYRLKPDKDGPIYVYKKFWNELPCQATSKSAPPILVYADLVTSYDPRDLEIADQIYEEFIKDKLE